MTMGTLPRRLGVAVVMAVIVWFLSVKLNTFRDYQIAEVAIEVTAVAGLTVLTGLSGQISLGNGAFMAIGGYTTALLMLHLNWPFIAALVARGRGHGGRRGHRGRGRGAAARSLPGRGDAHARRRAACPGLRLPGSLRRGPGPERRLHRARVPRA